MVLAMASLFGAGAVSAKESGKRIAIVYYSRDGMNYWHGGTKNLEKGNTARFAEKIQKLTGGDLFRIETVVEYPEDYTECTDVAKTEQEHDVRPQIKGALPDLSGYDVVFFGHPIWWGDMPMVMRTLLDKVSLAGKTVAHFVTHEGSGLGSSDRDLKARAKNASFLPSKAVAGTAVDGADREIADWVKSLKL
jgi:flavodoxin